MLCALSFISNQFFVLNLDGDSMSCLTNLINFDIPLLFCYINLVLSIICCFFYGFMYLLYLSIISFCESVCELFYY